MNNWRAGHKPVDVDLLVREAKLSYLQNPSFQQITSAVWFSKTGFRFADEAVWLEWRLHRTVRLWQAVALSIHLDPDSIRWRDFEMGSGLEGVRSIAEWLTERVAKAARHAESGLLPCAEMSPANPELSVVTLWEYAQWSDNHHVPCPVDMPRGQQALPASIQSALAPLQPPANAAGVGKGQYVRMSELAQGLVPFSKATIYRLIKKGAFPKPAVTSTGVSAWLRYDIEAWLQRQHPEGLTTKLPRKPRR